MFQSVIVSACVQKDDRVPAALKMLVGLIESLDYDEFAPLIDEICPRLITVRFYQFLL